MKQFFSLAEILAAGSSALPASQTGLKRLSRGWRGDPEKFRKASGREGGGGFEYHLSVLPAETQARLALIHSAPANDDCDRQSALRDARWANFERLSKKQKATCESRLEVLQEIDQYIATGLTETAAIAHVAERLEIGGSSIYRWKAQCAGVDREDWLAALAPAYKSTAVRAECHEDAWTALKSDYLRPEKPGFSACYRRIAIAADRNGWSPLPSERALRRRLNDEVPRAVQVAARDGRDTAKTLYPAQRRSRGHFHAMQAVNMDGHKFDVFVKLPGQYKPTRVHLLALQDLYSGKIVSWRLAISENKETVRLVIGDMVERHGIPDKIVLDNGRAFASKWITGQSKNRFRFKVREEEPQGLITALGIHLIWATPYSGQSKPIERAFRDLAENIAKHPICAGAYTGNNPNAKPENYGSKAIDFDIFREHVTRQISEHNARPGRRTQTANGRSFDEAFSTSLADPSSIVRWPTNAQKSLWLLAAERIRTKKGSGEIHLFGNRFWHQALNGIAGQSVTVRFDPDYLTQPLKVYNDRDSLICEAECISDAGFDDVEAARDHASKRNALMKSIREQKKLHAQLSADALAELYGSETPPEPKRETAKVKRLAIAQAPNVEPAWGAEQEHAFSRAMSQFEHDNIIDFPAVDLEAREETEPQCIEYGSKKMGGENPA